MPTNTVSALNPLASRSEIKAISSAADEPLRAEIAALKLRTAALHELTVCRVVRRIGDDVDRDAISLKN